MTKPRPIQVTDVILRDAHQSLIATRMRLDDMLPICQQLDEIGYWSLEVWGGATFDACIRFQKKTLGSVCRSCAQHFPIRDCRCCLEDRTYSVIAITPMM